MNVYYSASVEEFDNKDCFIFYFENRGMFLNTPDDTFKIFEKEFYDNSVNNDNIDTYAMSRGFEKVAKFWGPNNCIKPSTVEWYNDYEKTPDNIIKLRSRTIRANKEIYHKTILRVPRDKMIHTITGELLRFTRLLEKY